MVVRSLLCARSGETRAEPFQRRRYLPWLWVCAGNHGLYQLHPARDRRAPQRQARADLRSEADCASL